MKPIKDSLPHRLIAKPGQFKISLASVRNSQSERKSFSLTGNVGEVVGSAAKVTEDGLAQLEVEVVIIVGGVEANGEITFSVEAECVRCLEPFKTMVNVDFREIFVPDTVPVEDEVYTFHGDQLDLETLVRDEMTIALPLAPLCKSSCQGLCATCGSNRNIYPCKCEVGTIDSRWAGLSDLD